MMAQIQAGQWWGRVKRLAVAAVAVSMLAGSQAQADDLTPPTWNRTGANALRAHWGFEDPEHPSQPDGVHNPFQGNVQMVIGGGPSAYLENLTGRKGVWVLADPPPIRLHSIPGSPTIDLPGASMTITVPNANRAARKEVWVQVTFLGVSGKPNVDVPGFTKTGESVRNADADGQAPYTEDPDPNQPWKHLLTKWTAPNCPASETVKVSPPNGKTVKIDQLVIDTICR